MKAEMGAPALGVAFVVVVVVYATVALAFTGHNPEWYASLPRPSIQPPDWVFGVAWPVNFVSIAAVGWIASQRVGMAALPLWGATVASAVLAIAWAYFFYFPHALGPAAWCLAGAAACAWLMVALAARIWWPLGVGLLIYATWMCVATALSFGYQKLLA